MSFDLSAYLDMFRDEAAGYLSRLSDGLMALEQRPEDADLVNDLFRAAHSLKGSARMMDLTDVAEVAVGSSRVDLQACKLEYSIVSPK